MSEKEARMRRVTNADDRAVRQVAKAESENFSEPMSEKCIKDSLASPHFGLYVSEKDEKVVSYVATAGVFPEMQINSVASVEKRRGYAKELLTELLEEKKREGTKTVSLEVRASNATAIALYEHLGFRTVGRRKRLYEKPVEDGLEMITELQKNACIGN